MYWVIGWATVSGQAPKVQKFVLVSVWEEHRANRSDKGCKTVAAFKAHYFADW